MIGPSPVHCVVISVVRLTEFAWLNKAAMKSGVENAKIFIMGVLLIK
jgi:hypothetical protein